ncbi:MAG: hypothetical protein ACI978_002147 [Oleispira sp.]|jgi:hypothetical protein
MKIEDVLNKTCLIGLSYINTNGDLLKQAQYAGTVITVDKEEGITIKLDAIESAEKGKKADSGNEGTPNFHIPASLDAWFIAPKGHYKNAEHHIDIENPDYFVTWDVVKKKDDTEEGQQEWWEWHPQSQAPRVN